MNRETALNRIGEQTAGWDILVIGGGATGLGTSVDAASRGYKTLLLEQSDFAKATSSRSTKLIHGGFRYLKQGNIGLVRESLRERGLLIRNAPHLVHRLAFIVPTYHWWEAPYYGLGLKLYDAFAGSLGLGGSRHLSREEALRESPALNAEGLRGGIHYYDGQFDDARLAITLAQTVWDLFGVALNYFRVTRLLKEGGKVRGVAATDVETGRAFEIKASVVINATGIFTDELRRMDDPQAASMMATSQGIHIVLDRSFLPGGTAVMIPKTDDGRVLFAIPWHDRAVIGTTDTPVSKPELEPKPLDEEISYLLDHISRYLARRPARSDVLSVFAGLRPLVKTGDSKTTSKIARDHVVAVSPAGLVTITGGKWTTYRKMAEDTVNKAITVGGLEPRPCRTESLRLHGWSEPSDVASDLRAYGSDSLKLDSLLEQTPGAREPLHPRLPYRAGEVTWAVRHEMARTLEDVLSRRARALILDARACIEAAPKAAALMAAEFGHDEQWAADKVREFEGLARGYLPRP